MVFVAWSSVFHQDIPVSHCMITVKCCMKLSISRKNINVTSHLDFERKKNEVTKLSGVLRGAGYVGIGLNMGQNGIKSKVVPVIFPSRTAEVSYNRSRTPYSGD